MEEIIGDLFIIPCDAICIPTNGWYKLLGSNTDAACRAGIALKAAQRWPAFPAMLGFELRTGGHRVCVLTHIDKAGQAPSLGDDKLPYHVVSFPTKPSKIYVMEGRGWDDVMPRYRPRSPEDEAHKRLYVPGYMGYSNLDIIRHSAEELVELTDVRRWRRVCLPRVGAGLGGLKWNDVKAVLDPILDERFVVVEKK